MRSSIVRILALLLISLAARDAGARLQSGEVYVWEVQEITLATARDYANPYVEVECWVDLAGPDFTRRVHGFWDGGRTFKVRVVATASGSVELASGQQSARRQRIAGRGQLPRGGMER